MPMVARSKLATAGIAAAFIIVCQLAGILGTLVTDPGASAWYQGLEKPAFNPPSWVFGPVWTVLYTMMGVAAFLVWRIGWERREVRAALGLFAVQLLLNALWTPVFFGAERVLGGLIVLLLLLIAVALTTVRFFRLQPTAGWLMVPYLLWVAFATLLNGAIWTLN